MPAPPGRARRPPRWLAAIWVVGTIAAITVSVVAVRIAGAQVTARHSAPLSKAGVADAVAEERSVSTDPLAAGIDAGLIVTGDTTPGGASDDQGSDSSRSGVGSGSGSGGSASGSDSSGGEAPDGGSRDDEAGGSPGVTVAPAGGGTPAPIIDDGSDDVATTTTRAPTVTTFSRSTAGGAVTIRCSGATISLVSVTLASGWSKELSGSGPQEVEVSFHRGETEVAVHARCSGGIVDWS